MSGIQNEKAFCVLLCVSCIVNEKENGNIIFTNTFCAHTYKITQRKVLSKKNRQSCNPLPIGNTGGKKVAWTINQC